MFIPFIIAQFPETTMAVVTFELGPETREKIARDASLADQFASVLASGLGHAVAAGGDGVKQRLNQGELGLTMQHAGQGGLGDAVRGWMIDPELGAIGVPGNHPAAAYAAIHEYGGTITPKHAKALAVPISTEARLCTSPRDMADLVLIKRPGKAPILARILGDRVEVHWVLLASVTIKPTHWLSRGVELELPTMCGVLQADIDAWSDKW